VSYNMYGDSLDRAKVDGDMRVFRMIPTSISDRTRFHLEDGQFPQPVSIPNLGLRCDGPIIFGEK